MSAIFCSASLVPGISRRSTMAVVIDSTMRCGAGLQAGVVGRRWRARLLRPALAGGGRPAGGRRLRGMVRGMSSSLTCRSKCIHFCAILQAHFHRKRRITMGKLTTHVLDTANGCPAAGMAVALYRLDGRAAPTLTQAAHAQPRRPRRCAAAARATTFQPGRYRLVFEVAAYFRARGVALAEPPFLDAVPLDFGLADAGAALPRAAAGQPLGLLHLPRQLRPRIGVNPEYVCAQTCIHLHLRRRGARSPANRSRHSRLTEPAVVRSPQARFLRAAVPKGE